MGDSERPPEDANSRNANSRNPNSRNPNSRNSNRHNPASQDPNGHSAREARRAAESKRALNNAAQAEGLFRSSLAAQAKRARDHMMADNTDSEDRIEILATRIGRALSLALFIGLLIYLTVTYLL